MSNADPRETVPQSAQRTERPAPGTANSKQPRRAPRRKKPVIAIQLAPEDEQPHDESLTEKLKGEARAGLPGLGISMGVHAALLLVLALIVVSSRNREDPLLEFGWISAAASNSGQDDGKPLDIPVTITPLNNNNTSNNDTSSKTKSNNSESPVQGPPVKPADVKNILNGRDRSERSKMLERYGGGEATERAVNNGLNWLKRQQRAAGNWSLSEGYPDHAVNSRLFTDTGATALALLAFLGTGHTHLDGEHQETVARGLKWLKGIQKTDGNFFDSIEYGRQPTYYAHSQATIVMCEAYAMTGDENLRESAEAGIAFLVDSQQPIFGGWKYVKQDEATIGDLSVTSWALMALHTARVAGLDIPPKAFDLSSSFLDTVQEQNGARYKYEPTDPPGDTSPARTAMGLLCRQYLGWPREYPTLQKGVDYITQERNRPEWKAGKRNVFEWYYVGHVVHNVGGQQWKDWYQAAQEAIVPAQVKSGSIKEGSDVRGSWNPTEPIGSPHEYADQAGRLYITVMSILVLELPYRHLPVYVE